MCSRAAFLLWLLLLQGMCTLPLIPVLTLAVSPFTRSPLPRLLTQKVGACPALPQSVCVHPLSCPAVWLLLLQDQFTRHKSLLFPVLVLLTLTVRAASLLLSPECSHSVQFLSGPPVCLSSLAPRASPAVRVRHSRPLRHSIL